MDDEFRYPESAPPATTPRLVLWLMASVVLVGSVALALGLSTNGTVEVPITGLDARVAAKDRRPPARAEVKSPVPEGHIFESERAALDQPRP